MPTLEELIQEGMQLFKEGKFQELIDVLPNDKLENFKAEELFQIRAYAWYEKGRYDKAIEDFTKAIELKPGKAIYYFSRGIVWSDKKEYDMAVKDFTKAIELDPNDANAHGARGETWLKKEEYDEAIEDFTKAIELVSDEAFIYADRGIAWFEKKEYDMTIKDFTKAIELEPNDSNTHRRRGQAWIKKEEYENAIEDFTKAIQLKPNDAEAHCGRGEAWSMKAGYDKAIEDFKKAIELKPDYAEAYCGRGLSWSLKAKYENAIEDFKKAIELKPDYALAYYNLGIVYEILEKYSVASAYLKRSFHYKFNDISKLIDVFKERFYAPFILKDIFLGFKSVTELISYSNTFQEVINNCSIWNSYMEFLQIKDYPQTQPARFYSLEAIVNFYMGNSMEAYKIFDTKFECDGYPHVLTLRDQYYFTLSAIDFLEPYESILSFAIKQAKAEGSTNNVNRYYAGQLYLLNKDLENALKFFDECEGFLPALYAKIAIYNQQKNFSALKHTAMEIEKIESGTIGYFHFIEGIKTLELKEVENLEVVFSDVSDLIHYYESVEEIKEVRALLAIGYPYEHIEFNKIIRFTPSFEEEVNMASRVKELQELESYLADDLNKQAKGLSADALHEEIFDNSEAGNEFKDIQVAIEKKPKNKTVEDVLSLRIQNSVLDTEWYRKIILYFFLKGDYDKKTVLRLYLYILKVKMMGSGQGALSEDDKKKFSVAKDLILQFINLPVSLVYRTLSTVFTVLHLNLEKEKITDHSLDYKTFKEKYYENLGFFQTEIVIQLINNSTKKE